MPMYKQLQRKIDKRKTAHPQKKFFSNNLHHKSQIALFGQQLKDASEKNAKGEHLYFDPIFRSEYSQCYEASKQQDAMIDD